MVNKAFRLYKPTMNYARLLVVVCFLPAIPFVAAVAGSASEHAEFGVFVSDPYLTPGEEQRVTLDLQYQGDASENLTDQPVSNVSAELSVDDADSELLDVRTERQFVTDGMSANDTESVAFTVVASESLRFAEESSVDTTLHVYHGDGSQAELDVTLQATERAYFTADAPDEQLSIGESREVSFDIQNEGYEPARDAVVSIEPVVSGVSVEPPTDRSLGDLSVNQQQQVDVALTVADETLTGDVPLRVTVEFDDEQGVSRESRELTVPVGVADEQRFRAELGESTLRYGETGDVVLDVTNTGDTVTDATVQVQSSTTDVTIPGGQDVEYVSEWEGGEDRTVAVAAAVDETTPIEHAPLELTVDYRDDGSDRTVRETLTGVDIGAEQRFSGEVVGGGPLYIGESHTVELGVENTEYGRVTDATVQFQPLTGGVTLSDGADEVHVSEWTEDTTHTANLTVEVSETTAPDTVPVQAVVEYETEAGLTRESAPVTFTLPVADAQSFQASLVDSTLRYGEAGQATFEITNRAVNATDATVRVQSMSTHTTVLDGQSEEFVGEWHENTTRELTVAASTGDDAPVETIPFELVVDYRDDGVDRESRAIVTGTPVAAEQRFATSLPTDERLRAGETRTVTIELLNQQYGNISDAVVTAQVPDAETEIPRESAGQYVGSWDEGETHPVSLPIVVADDAAAGTAPVRLTVTYETQDGLTRQSAPLTAGIPVAPEQEFAIETTEADLAVGEDGTIVGSITNVGDEPVTGVQLLPEQTDLEELPTAVDGTNIDIREDRYYVGRLGAGETERFRLTPSVSGLAEPGPRAIALRAEYRNVDGDNYATGPHSITFEVEPEPDEFEVSVEEIRVPVDGSDTARLDVTNQLDEPVTDLDAQLFADDPLETDDNQAFVPRLEPNETVSITFTVGASSSAAQKIYPAEIDFQYTDGDGDTQLSDVYTVPVEVTSEQRNWRRIGLIGGLVTVGAGAVVLRYRESLPSIDWIR